MAPMKATYAPALPLPNPRDWATLTDAIEALQLSRQQVWRLIKSQRLKVYYLGRTRRGSVPLIWHTDLDALVAARKLAMGKPDAQRNA